MKNWLLWLGLAVLVYLAIGLARLLSLRNGRRRVRAEVEILLRRRYEIAARLAAAAPAFAAHGKDLQRRAAVAQASALTADAVRREEMESAFSSALDDLMEAGASDHTLRFNAEFAALAEQAQQVTLELTERLQRLNNLIYLHNRCVTEFPTIIFAAALGAGCENYFMQAEEEKRRAVADAQNKEKAHA